MGEPSDEPEPGTRSEGKAGRIESTASGAVTALELQTVERSHYAVADEHARGGMGRILAARDLRLDRSVAIKELIEPGPVQEARFVREALVTARLQHPAIVPVYEAGRWPSGEPFYAMKMVSGRSLKELIREAVGLEQRLALLPNVIAVADAIAYAHHQGILHRDLKPANILVGDFGETLVIDWGLAKDVSAKDEQADLGPYGIAASDLTVIGAVMGTPEYMAPEQAGGEALDARADVYALGAMLYHVLAGQAPFAGESSAEVLRQVRGGPPPAIEAREPRVPTDLAAIVGKAMARRPEERYPSAQELAADLRRFQAGQLVAAYRYSARERARRWIQRRRALLAVTLGGLLLAAVLLGLWLRSRFSASEQALAAQRFGQEVERIDRTLREAYLLPLHDIRAEKTLVRQRMQTIESEMGRLGSAAWGPGHYALGRGHLALHEYDAARPNLEAAWQSGYRPPEVAQALGQLMGSLYQRELKQALGIGNRSRREARAREIEKSFRDPALSYLRAAGVLPGASPAYAEALIAFYEKRYDESLSSARRAFADVPGMYEAQRLEGDVLVARGRARRNGGDYDGAAGDFDAAAGRYRAALEIGRSDPTVYEGECARRAEIVDLALARGGGVQEALAAGLLSCDQALSADPEGAEEAYNKKAVLYELQARAASGRGEDPRPLLAKMSATAETAVRENPNGVLGFNNLGRAYSALAEYERARGLDPRASIERAAAGFGKAIALAPSFPYAHNGLGYVYETLAGYEMTSGRDPRPALDHALAGYEKMVLFESGSPFGYNNVGNVHWWRAAYELQNGLDPRASLDQAIASYEKASEVDPTLALSRHNLGYALATLGEYALAAGLDPRPALERAVASYRQAIELNPKYESAYMNCGLAYATLARAEVEGGSDASAAVADATKMLGQALVLNPGDFEASLGLARIDTLRARVLALRRLPPDAAFRSARAQVERSLALNPTWAGSYHALAEVHRWRAEWVLARGGRPDQDVRAGLAALEKALRLNATQYESMALEGALRVLQARAESLAGKRSAAARSGQAALARALEANPLLGREFGPFAAEAARMAGDGKDGH